MDALRDNGGREVAQGQVERDAIDVSARSACAAPCERDTHGPLAGKIPGVEHYVQQHAVAAPEGQPPFLGVASLRFADQAAFEKAVASPGFEAAIADVASFADAGRLPTGLRRGGHDRRLTWLLP